MSQATSKTAEPPEGESQSAALQALSAFGRDIAFAADLGLIFRAQHRHVATLFAVDRFDAFTVAADRNTLERAYAAAGGEAGTPPAKAAEQARHCAARRAEVATASGRGLCLPLLADERLLGVVSVTARQALTALQCDTLRAFCVYAALALSHHDMLRTTELLRESIDQSDEAVSLYDAAGHVLYSNPAYHRIFTGYPPRERLRGLTHEQLYRMDLAAGIIDDPLAHADPGAYLAERMQVFHDLRGVKREIQKLQGRTFLYVRTRAAGGGTLSRRTDITDLKAVEAELRATQARLEDIAYHDALTGLPNRLVFTAEVAEALAAAAPDNAVAVLLLDLDRFKRVNDSLGAGIGDDVLRQAAARLRGCVGSGGLLARLGDDEFAILVADDPRNLAELADAVVLALDAPYVVRGRQVVAGTSIGIAAARSDAAPSDAATVEELLRRAYVALGAAKAAGRGTWRNFTAPMDAALQERTQIGLDLREAIALDQLHVVYQPVVELRGGRLSGFEALLRWTHPVRGLVPPAVFIPIAEEVGLIGEIGAWVLRRACADATAWPADVRLSVNVSALQFAAADLVETVTGVLAASGLPSTRLELEVTESVLLSGHPAALGMLHRLRAAGVGIALDDFGTGFASLSTLCNFPFTSIKIDQSFIRSINERRDSQAVVIAVTDLGHRLGMTTTAEGVETPAQLERLRETGCTRAQGYLIAQPLTQGDAARWIDASPGGGRSAA